jgi:hypothetical protein
MVQKCVASRWLLSASLGWGGGQIRGELWNGSIRRGQAMAGRGSLLTYKDDGNFRSHCDGLME